MPFLALTLLLMNNRTGWVGAPFQNRWWINVLLVVTLVFFAVTGVLQLTGAIPKSGA